MATPIEVKLSRYYGAPGLIDDTLGGSEITLIADYVPTPGNGVDDITESFQIRLAGTKETVKAALNAINAYLEVARRREARGYGDRVYLNIRSYPSGDYSWRRSEILDGRASFTETGVRLGLNSGLSTPATMTITRRGWFETTKARYMTITNENGSATGPSELYISNCLDMAGSVPNKQVDYIKVASAEVIGDLPSPVLILARGITTLAAYITKMYVGRAIGHYGTLVPTDTYTEFSGGGADGTCSGGAYATTSLTTSAETTLFTVSITDMQRMKRLGGSPFHVMARFRNNTSLANVKFRLKFTIGGATVWQQTSLKLLPTADLIQDLGVVNIPPGLTSEWTQGNIVITGQRTTAVTETIDLDFVQFFGNEFAKLTVLAPTANDTLRFGGADNIRARWSHGDSNLARMDLVVRGAQSMTLIPGFDNYLFFLHQTATATLAPINSQLGITLIVRPRWSSL